jgi:hypothetical protein
MALIILKYPEKKQKIVLLSVISSKYQGKRELSMGAFDEIKRSFYCIHIAIGE